MGPFILTLRSTAAHRTYHQSDCSGGFSLWVPVFTKSAHSGALIESLSANSLSEVRNQKVGWHIVERRHTLTL